MADGVGGVLNGVDNRLACLAVGHRICRSLEAIEQVTDPLERREFNEEVVRPETLADVKDAIDRLSEDLLFAGHCMLDQVKANRWLDDIAIARGNDDTEFMGRIADAVSTEINRPFRSAKQ